MPTAGDPSLSGGGVPLSHDPTQRINYSAPKLPVSIDDIINALVGWVEDFLFPAIKQLTGIDLSPFLAELKSVVTNLEIIFGSLNPLSGHFDPKAALQAFINLLVDLGLNFPIALIHELVGFVTGIPLIKQLIKLFSGGLFSMPVGSNTTAQPNLLPVPIFSPASITPNQDWTADAASERTPGNGSVKVVAAGHPKALRSGADPTDTITVGPGQTLTATIYVENQGYVGVTSSTPAVELQLAQFVTNTDGSQVLVSDFATLATYTPTGDLAWPGHQLTGDYTVPQGITDVQLRLLVTATAQAGTFHFADGSLTRTVDTSVIPGLPAALQFINGGIQTLVDTIVSVVRGIPIIGAGIADVIVAFENFNPLNIVGTLGSELLHGDLTGIVNTLFAAIRGQPVASSNASLADLYNAMSQLVHNVAGSDVTDFADTSIVIPVDPSWANYIDVVIIGEGQDGENGLIFNFFGQGGQPGVTNMTMWAKGTHYDGTLTGVTITVNSNGSITASIPGHSITAARGSGAESPHFGSGWPGIGPGGIDFNGAHYAGGGNQNTPGANGLGPGGGGAGGNGTLFQPGGKGAPAGAWVRRRTSAVTGQASGADTTAPSAPTVSVNEVTYSAITLTPSGSVDA